MASLLSGCATPKPYDYTNFRLHPPRSILVLPPLNESTAVEAPTVICPPLPGRSRKWVITFFRSRWWTSSSRKTACPVRRGNAPGAAEQGRREILGADAVLYITVEQYGSNIRSSTAPPSSRTREDSWTPGPASRFGKASGRPTRLKCGDRQSDRHAIAAARPRRSIRAPTWPTRSAGRRTPRCSIRRTQGARPAPTIPNTSKRQ